MTPREHSDERPSRRSMRHHGYPNATKGTRQHPDADTTPPARVWVRRSGPRPAAGTPTTLTPRVADPHVQPAPGGTSPGTLAEPVPGCRAWPSCTAPTVTGWTGRTRRGESCSSSSGQFHPRVHAGVTPTPSVKRLWSRTDSDRSLPRTRSRGRHAGAWPGKVHANATPVDSAAAADTPAAAGAVTGR